MSENKGKIEITIKNEGTVLDTMKDVKGIMLCAMESDGDKVAICGDMSIMNMMTGFVCMAQANPRIKKAFKMAHMAMIAVGDKELSEILHGIDVSGDKDAVPQEGSVEGAE